MYMIWGILNLKLGNLTHKRVVLFSYSVIIWAHFKISNGEVNAGEINVKY